MCRRCSRIWLPHVAGFQGCWGCSVKSAVCVRHGARLRIRDTCASCIWAPIRPLPVFAFMRLSWLHRQQQQHGCGDVMGSRCLSLIMFGRDAIFALARTYLCASRACQAARSWQRSGAERCPRSVPPFPHLEHYCV